jgi:hypothetical protein
MTRPTPVPVRLGLTGRINWHERQIVDARGTRHGLLDKQFGRAVRLAAGADHRLRLTRARTMLRATTPLRRFLGYCFGGLVALLFLLLSAVTVRHNWPPVTVGQGVQLVVPFLFAISAYTLIAMLANRQGHSADKTVAIREMLKRDLCPACGGDLAGIERAEDGTRECRRCLAVWE